MSPTPGDAERAGAGRGRRWRTRCVRGCLRLLLLALVALLAILLWLHEVGVPRRYVDRWVAALEDNGTIVGVDRIRFSPWRGALGDGFRIYDSPLKILPMMEAETVQLDLDPGAWLGGKAGLTAVRVQGGTVRFAPHGLLHEALPDEILEITELAGAIEMEGRGMRVSSLEARLLGMRVSGGGMVHRVAGDTSSRPSFTRGPVLGRLVHRSASSFTWLRELIFQLNQVAFDREPVWTVQFDVFPDRFDDSRIRIGGRGGASRLRGVMFDRWQCKGNYENRRLEVEALRVEVGPRAVSVEGTYDVDTETISARIHSTLPPLHWLSLVPADWRDALAKMNIHAHDQLDSELVLGPEKLASLWNRVEGRIRGRDLELRDIWFKEAAFAVRSADGVIALSDIDARAGRDEDAGRMRGMLQYDVATEQFSGAFTGSVHLAELDPLWPRPLRDFFQRFQFEDTPPYGDFRFSGHRTEREYFRLDGDFNGESFVYMGAYIDRADLAIAASNRWILLDDLHVDTATGSVDGDIGLEFANKLVTLDAAGNAHPQQIGLAVGSKTFDAILRNFTFEGPVQFETSGTVHVSTNGVSDLRLRLGAEDMAVKSWMADAVSFDLHWRDRTVDLGRFDAAIFGGKLAGNVRFQAPPRGVRSPLRFEVNVGGEQMRFEDVVRTLVQKEGEPYRGTFGGQLRLAGEMGTGVIDSLDGEGYVSIEKGRILEIPVFGGLSTILTNLYSGLGVTRQTELRADLVVKGRDLEMPNVELVGDVFSLHGDGAYDMVTTELDYDVEFKLLGDGVVGSVVRLVTTPITRLLEFDLEGTMAEPRWRPKNLPKELWPGES